MSSQPEQGGVQYVTRRYLDRRTNPPRYVDEELPTSTVTFRGPLRRGAVRAPRGTILGSFRVTGSFYDYAPGSYSLRITRLSVFAGSREAQWMIRHSRVGTVDIQIFSGSSTLATSQFQQRNFFGDPMRPLYSFGPGTVTWGFVGNHAGSIGTRYTMGQFMEGVIG